jgi:hypothetical protein
MPRGPARRSPGLPCRRSRWGRTGGEDPSNLAVSPGISSRARPKPGRGRDRAAGPGAPSKRRSPDPAHRGDDGSPDPPRRGEGDPRIRSVGQVRRGCRPGPALPVVRGRIIPEHRLPGEVGGIRCDTVIPHLLVRDGPRVVRRWDDGKAPRLVRRDRIVAGYRLVCSEAVRPSDGHPIGVARLVMVRLEGVGMIDFRRIIRFGSSRMDGFLARRGRLPSVHLVALFRLPGRCGERLGRGGDLDGGLGEGRGIWGGFAPG